MSLSYIHTKIPFISSLAWISFSCCMAAAVLTLNSYTKIVIETNRRAHICLEEAAGHAPPYDDIIMTSASGSIYSINLPLQHCQQGKLIDTIWPSRKDVLPGVMTEVMNSEGLVQLSRCRAQGCVDCEREMDGIKDLLEKGSEEEDDDIC